MLTFVLNLELIKKTIEKSLHRPVNDDIETYESIKEKFVLINRDGLFDEQIKKIDSIIELTKESINENGYYCPDDDLRYILNSIDFEFKRIKDVEKAINIDYIVQLLDFKTLDLMECQEITYYLHKLGERLLKINIIPDK
jgi:hypothetical protein